MRVPEKPYVSWQVAVAQGLRARIEQIEKARQNQVGPKEEFGFSSESFWEEHRNSLSAAAAILGIPLGLSFLSACSQPTPIVREATPTPKATPTLRPTPTRERSLPPPTPTQERILQEIKTPVWNITDLEQYKQERIWQGRGMFCLFETKENKEPPFYTGPMPLVYKVAYAPGDCVTEGNRAQRGIKPTFYSLDFFRSFENHFIYDGVRLIGAQTYDRSERGNLLAEVVNINYFITGDNKQGVEIEELHYEPDGKPVFKSKSQIDPSTGFKIGEKEIVGKKERDYYFIWPVAGR